MDEKMVVLFCIVQITTYELMVAQNVRLASQVWGHLTLCSNLRSQLPGGLLMIKRTLHKISHKVTGQVKATNVVQHLKSTPEKYVSLKPFLDTLPSEWNRTQTWSWEEMYGGGIVDPQAL